tara:strand:+ start:14775 stop:14939 length:165 start_codon:yes stop_codon:yes gene_type:complete
MRHFTTTLLLLYTLIGFSQEKKTVYKEYSFTQLFKMIKSLKKAGIISLQLRGKK